MLWEPMVTVFQMMKAEIDEQLMKNIARKQMENILEQLVMTNLKYMRINKLKQPKSKN
jgi:hypothetical protein